MNFKCNAEIEPIFDIPFSEKDRVSPYAPKGIATSAKTRINCGARIPRPQLVMQNIRNISTCIHRNAAIDYNNTLWTWGARCEARMDNGARCDDMPL